FEHLYIIRKGAVERYYKEDEHEILREFLSDGDIFGGVSMLLHNGISARMLRTKADTDFYLLPKKYFLDLCARYEAFSDYFTDIYGKLMLDKSFAAIIAKGMQRQDEVPQFFNQPVGSVYARDLVFCDTDVTIQDAAVMMSRRRCSSIFIREPGGDFVGIVTDNDLRKKVIGPGYDIRRPVAEIMSSPLGAVPARAPIFEALMSMMQKNLKHLAVTDAGGKVIGAVTIGDLIAAQGQSAFSLIREINTAGDVETLADKHSHLPSLIQNLINSGVKADNVARLVSTISDAILSKLIQFAIDELGPPPAGFVFLILGSEGRSEQTLKTDQDNAILFEDQPVEFTESVRGYFLKFGEKVCTWLDQAGYAFCNGDVMAKNPQWCQPLSVWKEYFTKWISTVEPEALLQSSIFFDFRGGYGDMALAAQLRSHLFASIAARPNFFRYLAENSLYSKPPLGFFGNFIVESKGEHRDAFDIKSSMTTIVNFARAYALYHGIDETNTQERLNRLFLKEVLSWRDYHEIEQSYSFLMQLRFVRQVAAIMRENAKPDNYITPKTLSRMEQTMLREIFKSIEKFQAKMSFDFIGVSR
ncbi:MAG: signal transduction protein, partial [Syntrophus sp. (in: bacteria)]|nr:signal transduction protein [Syntrophus sp. (in: bacteria)]